MSDQTLPEPPKIWPCPQEVAAAVVAAARELGENPLRVVMGRGSRARCYAIIALGRRFPDLPRVSICRMTGDRSYSASMTTARSAVLGRNCGWFDLALLNRVNAFCGYPAMTLADAQDATLSAETRAWRGKEEAAPSTLPAPNIPEIMPQFPGPADAMPILAPSNEAAKSDVDAPPEPPPWREIDGDDLVGDGDHRPPLGTFTPSPGAAAAIASLKNNECRWPIGLPSAADFRFCCAPVARGREPRYCDRHFKLHPK
jgi:hypothetical protein